MPERLPNDLGHAGSTRLNTRDDHHCFGCGKLNAHGLQLDFYAIEGGTAVAAEFVPKRDHEGFAGLVHGGIISAVLDEGMGWAINAREIMAVTGKMAVSFRRPVEVGEPTWVIGRLIADRGRLLETRGELRRAADDLLLAESTGTFMRVPAEQAAEWQARYRISR